MNRKDPRLAGYDYGTAGDYFVTVCTQEKRCTLGKAVGGDVHIAPNVALTDLGHIVEQTIQAMPGIEYFVVMPNHIHFVVRIGGVSGPMRTSAPTLAKLVRSFKTLVTKAWGKPVWQRNYYDHVVRDEADGRRIAKYIDENPAKWAQDAYYPPTP